MGLVGFCLVLGLVAAWLMGLVFPQLEPGAASMAGVFVGYAGMVVLVAAQALTTLLHRRRAAARWAAVPSATTAQRITIAPAGITSEGALGRHEWRWGCFSGVAEAQGLLLFMAGEMALLVLPFRDFASDADRASALGIAAVGISSARTAA
jgi:hypothetical protein